PMRFEPGVPSMAQAVGTAAAVDYLEGLGMARVEAHVRQLSRRCVAALSVIPGVTVLTSADAEPVSAVSFTVDGVHPHDVGQVLDDDGVAVRVGHHCAWPLMRALGVPATVRASFSVYSTDGDIEALAASVTRVGEFFA
ncbi:MAG: aminotransferase class V-fold PLP-dependent enzyme, partial [Actinobacteria bacterium]|nr:aminotransferase class V-fold PLP-dependent enzyme [Actinomycetota bacterium]